MVLPIIDLAPFLHGDHGQKRKVAEQVNDACRDTGFLIVVNHEVDPALPDRVFDLAANDNDREILEFVSKSFAVGRPIGTTPDVPPERLAALRKAFDDTLVDPTFIAEAAKVGAEIKPMDGKTLEGLINDILGAPQELKDRVKAVLPPR